MGGLYKKESKTGTPPMGEEGGSKEEEEKKRRKESENERSTHTNERTNGRTLLRSFSMRPCSLFYIPEV